MKFMSIFSLREKGGPSNYPSKIVNNPQGGIVVLPFFGKYMKKYSEHGNSSWDIPSLAVDNPQGGSAFIPIFGPHMLKKMHKEKWGSKGGAKKPATTKAPKPLRPKKGKPVHKKLHDTIHPILAESLALLTGKFKAKQSEATSSSMTPLVTAAGQKKQKQSKFKIETSRFREAKGLAGQIPTDFRVVLLEEGMGNSTDVYYYTKDALESGVAVFTGLKIYADHPSAEEEQIRPERSTKDILGHYENLAVEQGPNGQHWLCGDLKVLPSSDTEWARSRMMRAIENADKFPDHPFIGLSINASGPSEAMPIQDVIDMAPMGAKPKLEGAQAEGTEVVKVVSQINRAVSCDLVTEAGAGGKILNIIGGDSDGQKTA
jgi:hypothetical protein